MIDVKNLIADLITKENAKIAKINNDLQEIKKSLFQLQLLRAVNISLKDGDRSLENEIQSYEDKYVVFSQEMKHSHEIMNGLIALDRELTNSLKLKDMEEKLATYIANIR